MHRDIAKARRLAPQRYCQSCSPPAAGAQAANGPYRRATRTSWLLPMLAMVACASQAARPLASDDAGVQAVGDCEWDSYAGRANSRGEPGSTGASTQFGCGAFQATYAGIAFARDLSGPDSPQTLVLAGKTALLEATADVAGYAIAWGSVGKKVRGTSFRYDGWYATLSRSVSLASGWTVHTNLGASYQHDSHALTARWALAAEHAIAGRWRGGIESFGESRDRAPWVQAGASLDLPFKGVSVNSSWGTQLSGARNRLATAGLTCDF